MSLENLLEEHIKDETERDKRLEDRLVALEKQMSTVVDIMTQAKGAVSLIKIVTGVLATIAATWAFLNTNFTVMPK